MGKKAESPSKADRPVASQSLAKILPRKQSESSLSDKTDRNDGQESPRRPQRFDWRSGSWRGKAAAVAALTQSVSAAAGTAADTAQAQIAIARAANPGFRSLRAPRKSEPSIASPTFLSVIANGQSDSETNGRQPVLGEKKDIATEQFGSQIRDSAPHPGVEDAEVKSKVSNEMKERPLPQSMWGGWWIKSTDVLPSDDKPSSAAEGQTNSPNASADASRGTQLPSKRPQSVELGPSLATPASGIPLPAPSKQEAEDLQTLPNDVSEEAGPAMQQNRSSWFGLWAGASGAAADQNTGAGKEDPLPPKAVEPPSEAHAEPSSGQTDTQLPRASDSKSLPQRGSASWAFWSKDQPRSESTEDNAKRPTEIGELAVAESQNAADPIANTAIQPLKPSSIKDLGEKLSPASTHKSSSSTSSLAKQAHSSPSEHKTPLSDMSAIAKGKIAASKAATSPEVTVSMLERQQLAAGSTPVLAAATKVTPPKATQRSSTKKPQLHPNIVIPSFHDTFPVAETTTYWEQLMQMLWRGAEPEVKHVAITPSPPRIKHALAIGIHGLFPAPLVQKVLGQPTGTSIRFANGVATAIQKWTSDHGYSCEIEKVALEGEGLIADRVDTLWKLLLNWLDKICTADFIMVACHSQGVPVAMMLMAKLISLGCLNPSARLGICAMAGVSLGPFPSYIGKMFGPAATELFSFSSPSSTVSKLYLAALRTCLAHHVRVTYTGSLDDQLVSLESAVFATASHPYIYRAVFVDGRVHAPDFLVKLVGFAIKLRNMGVGDHGLIRELSAPVAGSLYSSEGHSRVYEETAVYDVAVQFALETTTVPGKDVGELLAVKEGYEVPGASGATNPYFLPWAMRGALEEMVVKEGIMKREAEELLKAFEEWRPATKVLKDVKFRLEAVSSQGK